MVVLSERPPLRLSSASRRRRVRESVDLLVVPQHLEPAAGAREPEDAGRGELLQAPVCGGGARAPRAQETRGRNKPKKPETAEPKRRGLPAKRSNGMCRGAWQGGPHQSEQSGLFGPN